MRSFIEFLNETSRADKAVSAFLGRSKNIRTIGIMSPENPMGRELSPAENRDRCNQFENILKKGKIQFYKVKGMYGNVEHSYFLYNIDLAFLKKWCSTDNFNQESFFLCKTKYDEETRKTGCVFAYYKKGEHGTHKLVEESEKFIDANSFDDYFTQLVKAFKFSIAMKEFGNLAENLESYTNQLEENRNDWSEMCTFDEALDKIVDENYVGLNKLSLRSKINKTA